VSKVAGFAELMLIFQTRGIGFLQGASDANASSSRRRWEFQLR
jgi:hypothetical protein